MKGAVRISSGSLKGARLKVPRGVRPTSQKVREALFSRWQDRMQNAEVLDLFAGSGAIGLEAVSRGAARVVSVEGRRQVGRELETACRVLAGGAVEVRFARLPEEGRRLGFGRAFDLVFADPPYDFDRWSELLTLISGWLRPGAEAALEHSVRMELPSEVTGLERASTRRYGESCLSFYAAADPPAGEYPAPVTRA